MLACRSLENSRDEIDALSRPETGIETGRRHQNQDLDSLSSGYSRLSSTLVLRGNGSSAHQDSDDGGNTHLDVYQRYLGIELLLSSKLNESREQKLNSRE